MDPQARVLELYRSGRHREAFALQEGLDRGRLLRVRERGADLLAQNADVPPVFFCGAYEPRRRAAPSSGISALGLGCSYSEAILRLKSLRTHAQFARRPDALALSDALAARLARRLRALRRAGALGGDAPVLLSPVPGAKAGPPAFGLCRVVERACALAGRDFLFRILLLRGLDLPPSHLSAVRRGCAPHLASLLPLREAQARGRTVVLVDDVCSSGSTLRASAVLAALFNGARPLGLALARTRALAPPRKA